MLDRIDKLYASVVAFFQHTETAALAAWASLGTILLVLFGVYTLWRTVQWIKNKPPVKEVGTEVLYLAMTGGVMLVATALPLGLIALSPTGQKLIEDLGNALLGQ